MKAFTCDICGEPAQSHYYFFCRVGGKATRIRVDTCFCDPIGYLGGTAELCKRCLLEVLTEMAGRIAQELPPPGEKKEVEQKEGVAD